jgi:uncharacterized cupredoxin-like copper-binding protein
MLRLRSGLRMWFQMASVLLAVGALLTACAAQPTGPTTVNVELSTYGIKPSATSVKAGDVVFKVTNTAADLQHEFLVVKADEAIADLPYDTAENRVPEDKINSLGEVAELAPGKSGELKLKLEPGKYILMCNIATHLKAGMAVPFTVTP